MKTFFLNFFIFVLSVAIISCNSTQSRIDTVINQLKKAEIDVQKFSKDEWQKLDQDIAILKEDYLKNKETYTDEQRRQISQIKGRYTAIQIKKGASDLMKDAIDFGTEIENIYNGLSK